MFFWFFLGCGDRAGSRAPTFFWWLQRETVITAPIRWWSKPHWSLISQRISFTTYYYSVIAGRSLLVMKTRSYPDYLYMKLTSAKKYSDILRCSGIHSRWLKPGSYFLRVQYEVWPHKLATDSSVLNSCEKIHNENSPVTSQFALHLQEVRTGLFSSKWRYNWCNIQRS